MKKYTSIISGLLILTAMSLGSCSRSEKNPKELYDKCSSGVVMIMNQYYYTINLPDGEQLYFSDLVNGELKGLCLEKEEIEKNKAISFGTGFFISKDGKIMTNRHVVSPYIEKSESKQLLKTFFDNITALLQYKQQEMSDQYDQLSSQIQSNTYFDEFGNVTESPDNTQLREQQDELRTEYNNLNESISNLNNIDMSEVTIESTCSVSVAFNDSFVTNASDFKNCAVTKVSDDENADLAIIQLTDKTTPEDRYVFHFLGDNKAKDELSFISKIFVKDSQFNEPLKVQDPVCMIGYNQGIVLASTQQGIKAQITSGNVSQEPDDTKILYNISTLAGSSGSPVLNKYGDVVGVNFAKLNNTQNFNFGIPMSQIRKFLNL
jgi:S1-C subfamily serine protease